MEDSVIFDSVTSPVCPVDASVQYIHDLLEVESVVSPSSELSVDVYSELLESPVVVKVIVPTALVVTPISNFPRLLPHRSNRQTRYPERFDPSLYMIHHIERYL